MRNDKPLNQGADKLNHIDVHGLMRHLHDYQHPKELPASCNRSLHHIPMDDIHARRMDEPKGTGQPGAGRAIPGHFKGREGILPDIPAEIPGFGQ